MTLRKPGFGHLLLVLVVAAATTASLSSSSSAANGPGCTDTSTACLESVAMTYVNAIGSKDPATADAILAAPDVQRWENGLHNVSSRAQLVTIVKNTQQFVSDVREVRLFADRDGQDVFALYLVDAGVGSATITAHVMERIQIQNGLITAIEILQCDGGPAETSMGTATDISGTLDVAVCLRANPAVPAGLPLGSLL